MKERDFLDPIGLAARAPVMVIGADARDPAPLLAVKGKPRQAVMVFEVGQTSLTILVAILSPSFSATMLLAVGTPAVELGNFWVADKCFSLG